MTNRLDPYYTGPAAEPVTSKLQALQRQADAIARRLDQHLMDDDPVTAGLRQVEDLVHDLRQDFTHHLDLHEGLDGGEEPDGVLTGPTGDGQSDLDMIKYSQQLREAYRTFMRYAADPTVARERFDLVVHDFREQVFELTRQMRIIVANREGRDAQAG